MVEGRLSQLRREGGYSAIGSPARVRISGSDRLRYLNGQLTNDLRRLVPGTARLALVLTARGKLTAVVSVWLDAETIVVEADGVPGEDLLARLERYAIADDVVFEILPEENRGWHVFGPASAGRDGLQIARLGEAGVDLAAPPDGLVLAAPEEIEILRIERGVPKWQRELNEDTLPQEAGLEKTAVDFQKGCYVGQEVVSRIQSVGRVNRILAGFLGDFDPKRASALQTPTGEKAGTITSAVFHPDLGRTVALGFRSTKVPGPSFIVVDESGACLGGAECSEFPLVS